MAGPRPPLPLLSVLTVVHDPPRPAFEATVASVLAQTRRTWEWIVVDDCSLAPWVRDRLDGLAASDPRIHVHHRETSGGIAAASADALSRASGEFVAVLDHGDVLVPRALGTMARAAVLHPDVDHLYSDHDQLTDDGASADPLLKPAWSPERLRHHLYTGHLSVYRRALVVEVGGFRAGFEASRDHDLALRVAERARRVEHVPLVLHHRRAVPDSTAGDEGAQGTGGTGGTEPDAWAPGVRTVQDHLDRVGVDAVAGPGARPGFYRVRRAPDLHTSVSVVIPTAGTRAEVWGSRRTLVTEAVRSMVASSRHPSVEYVVVHDATTPTAVLDELRAVPGAHVRLVRFDEPFNFSAKCNVGALHGSGEVLVFVNDDVEARSEGLVEQLIAPLREPGVGMTGAKLLYPSMRVQHAGLTYGSGSVLHAHHRRAADEVVVAGELDVNREVTALTGACVAVRRSVFERVGGFSEQLPINFNDVDLSHKVRRLDLRLLWLSEVELFHFESMTRSTKVRPWEIDFLIRRWGNYKVLREELSATTGPRPPGRSRHRALSAGGGRSARPVTSGPTPPDL